MKVTWYCSYCDGQNIDFTDQTALPICAGCSEVQEWDEIFVGNIYPSDIERIAQLTVKQPDVLVYVHTSNLINMIENDLGMEISPTLRFAITNIELETQRLLDESKPKHIPSGTTVVLKRDLSDEETACGDWKKGTRGKIVYNELEEDFEFQPEGTFGGLAFYLSQDDYEPDTNSKEDED